MNSWDRNLLEVRGVLRLDKCSYTVHRVNPTKDGEWEYVQEKLAKVIKVASVKEEELDNLWEDIDENELDDMDPIDTLFPVPLTNRDAAAIKRLANNKSVENLGL